MKAALYSVGDELTPLIIPLTPTRIAAGAIATGDFEPLHHDRTAAEQAGRRDVFMNILMINGILQRCVTDWAGPTVRIRSIALRLGAPNVAGDVFTVSGHVVAREETGNGEELVSVDLRGTNQYGTAVTARISFGHAPAVR